MIMCCLIMSIAHFVGRRQMSMEQWRNYEAERKQKNAEKTYYGATVAATNITCRQPGLNTGPWGEKLVIWETWRPIKIKCAAFILSVHLVTQLNLFGPIILGSSLIQTSKNWNAIWIRGKSKVATEGLAHLLRIREAGAQILSQRNVILTARIVCVSITPNPAMLMQQ